MWLWYSLLSGFTRRGVVARMIANERLKVGHVVRLPDEGVAW